MAKRALPPEIQAFPARLELAMLRADAKESGLGLPQPTVNRLRKGKRPDPPGSTIVHLAHALGVRPGWLLSGEEPMHPTVPLPARDAGTADPAVLLDLERRIRAIEHGSESQGTQVRRQKRR